MPDHKEIKVLRTDLHRHPAIQAWRELGSAPVEIIQIEIIKGFLPEHYQRTKKYVCRLVGIGRSGSSVIAKWCKHRRAEIEYKIYQEILPDIPMQTLKCYGMVEEANRGFCWLFVEDAGNIQYSEHIQEHRLLGALWLAQMHTSAIKIAAATSLPQKGPKQYLKRLQSTRDTIQQDIIKLQLQKGDFELMKSIVGLCNDLETRWDQVVAYCENIPCTFVHGDFTPKNSRVRNSLGRNEFLPFDWGQAGWGMPAIDIVHVDASSYLTAVSDHWPWLNDQSLQRWLTIGKLFRCIDALHWNIPSFEYKWLKKPLSYMKIYRSWLAEAIQEL